MTRLGRGVFIVWVALRYGLDELVLTSFQKPWLRLLARVVSVGRNLDAPRGQRLREALERLGPIFVKFGQVLSTRRDLLPLDIANELAKLQDRVPPFPSEVAVATIERALGKPLAELFDAFEHTPVASASIAQVHFAVLRDRQGTSREVAVKVLRPGMLKVIDKDLGLMRMMAGWLEGLSADGKRLKPREVVAEFDKYLHDELDFVREAANAAQLRRNMDGLDLVLIPEMVWDLCTPGVMVMQRMHGVPISQLEAFVREFRIGNLLVMLQNGSMPRERSALPRKTTAIIPRLRASRCRLARIIRNMPQTMFELGSAVKQPGAPCTELPDSC